MVELTGLIAFQNLSNNFDSALDVPAQGFCMLPEDRGSSAGATNDEVRPVDSNGDGSCSRREEE